MKLILKLINWINKRRFVKIESKLDELRQTDSKEHVLYLAELLEKELKDKWGLIPDASNENFESVNIVRHGLDENIEVYFYDHKKGGGFVNIKNY